MLRRTAIVRGPTRGIGPGIAEARAGAGSDIVPNGFGDPAGFGRTSRRAARFGVKVIRSAADRSDAADIAAMVGDARDRFGRIGAVLSSAGVQTVAPVEEVLPERRGSILAVNPTAAIHRIRRTLAEMRQRGRGRVITVASAQVRAVSPSKSAHLASRRSVPGLARAVAREAAVSAIAVEAIGPGHALARPVAAQIPETPRARGLGEKAVRRERPLAAQATRRFVRVDEVGALAAVFCSDAAAIAGAARPVDGGWTAP